MNNEKTRKYNTQEIKKHNEKVYNFYKYRLQDIFRIIKQEAKVKELKTAIGGSLAAYIHGMNFGRKIGDIDIIVNKPTYDVLYHTIKYSLNCIFEIVKDCTNYPKNSSFKFKTISTPISINIIETKEEIDTEESDTEFDIVTIENLLQTKTDLDRQKDRMDVMIILAFMENIKQSNV